MEPFRVAFAALSVLAGHTAGDASESAKTIEANIGFVGDTGSGTNRARRVANAISRVASTQDLSHLFLLGDNVYPNGNAKLIPSRFSTVYQSVLDQDVSIHAALGNHDVKDCPKIRFNSLVPRDASAYKVSTNSCWVASHLNLSEFGYAGRNRYYRASVSK